MNRDRVIIGVDGGGSGCRVALATVNRGVVARAKGGPANVSSDLRGAVGTVLFAVQDAAQQAAFTVEDLRHAVAHLGLAGVMGQTDVEAVSRALPFAACTVTDDRPTTAVGALGDGDGFVAAIGTGSFVGRRDGGVFRAVGGWGLSLSDQASGAWLGRKALVQVLLAHDRVVQASALTDDLMARFNGDANAVFKFGQTAMPVDYARLAPQVVDAAQAGCGAAQDIVMEGAGYIVSALAALGYADGAQLCMTGGLGPAYVLYLPRAMQAAVIPAAGTALDGALALARGLSAKV